MVVTDGHHQLDVEGERGGSAQDHVDDDGTQPRGNGGTSSKDRLSTPNSRREQANRKTIVSAIECMHDGNSRQRVHTMVE